MASAYAGGRVTMSPSFYRTSKGRLLFGLPGRITRTDFCVGLSALVGITTLAVVLGGNRVRGGGLGEFFAVVTVIAVLSPFCLVAIVVKRLHDLDKSAWHVVGLLAGLLLAALAAMAYWGLQEGSILQEWQRFWTLTFYETAGLAAALLGYLIVKLGFTRGTPGPNQFGPDPSASEVQENGMRKRRGTSQEARTTLCVQPRDSSHYTRTTTDWIKAMGNHGTGPSSYAVAR